MELDFIFNGQAHGSVGERLLAANGDVGTLRPFIGDDGYHYSPLQNGENTIITNAPASLRFQDWRLIDEAIIRVAKPRLRLVGDLRGAGLEVNIPNGMGYTVFSFERQSDISPAIISMDGLRMSQSDRPVFDIINMPLPIIHKDFSFSARQIMASRNGYSPLDVTTAQLAARRVAEQAEQLALGTLANYTYGGGTIYGLVNFPNRITYSMTSPTVGGWTPAQTVQDVLAMRLASQLAYHFGPWMIYTSPNWDQYLDADYSSAKGDWTLRNRLRQIDGVLDVKTIDYFQFQANNPYTMVMVQMTEDVVREVIGLDITTLQWESNGGMEMNFKVMCIMCPQVRADQNSNSGIVHGSASFP